MNMQIWPVFIFPEQAEVVLFEGLQPTAFRE